MTGTRRRTAIVGSLAAFAVASSALFGGFAFADEHGEHNNAGGPGGSGGTANANCLLPIGISLGILGQGGPVSQCNATGGPGNAGGTGANY